LMDIDRDLGRIATDMILVDAQLTMIDPMAAAVLPDGTVLPSPRAQLRAAQSQLVMLEGQYQAGHPDIARARREVDRLSENAGTSEDLTDSKALLENARAELAAARTQYSPEHPEILRLERLVKSLEDLGRTSSTSDNSGIAKAEPDNPAWVEISARRRGMLADQAALENERRELRRRLQEYESRMLIMPQVEQELSALERSLSSATQRFFAMRARQFGAEMGEALETQSKGERFVLVEPPNLPLEPSSPNRPVLIILLLILAPAIGLAMVPLKESIDQSIWGSKMLDSIQGGPPIAEIPVIATRADAVKATRVRIAAMVGAPITILIAALVVHFALRPLDVLWYVVLRKLGI
jgi:succinoglycan biosynthesis transport protein ExoP